MQHRMTVGADYIDQLVDRPRARPQPQRTVGGDGKGLEALTEDEKEVLAFSNMKGMDHMVLRYETYKRGYLSESDWESYKFFIDLVLR